MKKSRKIFLYIGQWLRHKTMVNTQQSSGITILPNFYFGCVKISDHAHVKEDYGKRTSVTIKQTKKRNGPRMQ